MYAFLTDPFAPSGNRVIFANRSVANASAVGKSSQTPVKVERRRCQLNQDEETVGKNTSVRASILSRAGASGELVGSANAVWAVKRVRPGSES